MNPLVLDKMPLAGQQLIEASAGTGKTYTISHLVLRLIIKAQDQLRSEPLSITEILVVTFTRAATQELKDRIRDILHRAKDYLEDPVDADENLALIVDQALAEEDKDTLILRCHRAILMLDDAPVFTIHGFCQRILNDFSFSTGQAIEQTLVEDDRDILRELTQRLWRQTCYPLNKERAVLVKKHVKSPEALLQTLRPVLKSHIKDPAQSGDVWQHLDKTLTSLDDHWQKAADLWQQESAVICGFFSKGIGRSYTKRWVGGWLEALGGYLADEENRYFDWDKSEKFCQSHLDSKLADDAPKHALFDVLDDIHAAIVSLKPLLLAHFRYGIIAALETYQSEQGVLFFDDLIQRLATASQSDELCNAIRQRYPVALIDEFQDTDQWQYTIFQRIYSQKGTGLLMIGDPKQAIYSFRGADIDAYFKARKAVSVENRFTLMTNHRTIPSLIQQVNSLFSSQTDAFCIDDFPAFIQVDASSHQNDNDALRIDNESNSFSVIELKDEDTLKKSDAKQMAADKTARWIKKLLDEKALINQRPIEPKDIAILVRKGAQADLVKNALNEVGINSVFLSKDSVLTSDEASAFVTLIKAMIEPYQSRLIHKALGDSLIAMDAASIYDLSQHAKDFDKMQQRFIKARDLWKKQGFYSGFESLITDFCLPASLLALKNGERRLTNLHQLSDVFSQLENPHLSFTDHLHAFEKKCAEAKAGDETQKLRLETEANLVEIVTIHKSKGMEYPLVCCPFVFEDNQGMKKQVYTLFNEKTEERELFWQLDNKQKQALAMDELAEDVRLLYVALTRAKCHLSICWGDVKGLDKSALFHLLYHRTTKQKELSSQALWEPFKAVNATLLRSDPVSKINEVKSQPTEQLSARILKRSLHTDYYARSYSALVKNDAYLQDNIDDDPSLHKDRDEQSIKSAEVEPFQENIFHFPKGSEAGNFIHQVLEDVDFADEGDVLPNIVEHHLERYQFDQKLWQDVVTSHVKICLEKPLSPIDCSLSALGNHQVLKEMGFQLNAEAEQGGKLRTLLSSYRNKPLDMAFNPIHGDFKGFVDLIFCYQDKYYVLDYKSNFLGYETTDYDQDNMQEAIEHHAYDLQYLVYQAALQRYLKSRLPDFDYDQHMGGVFYLFLRGMNADNHAGIFYTKPDALIVDAFESLFITDAA